jgi:hypothetical protein
MTLDGEGLPATDAASGAASVAADATGDDDDDDDDGDDEDGEPKNGQAVHVGPTTINPIHNPFNNMIAWGAHV